MAVAISFGYGCRPFFRLSYPLRCCALHVRVGCSAAIQEADDPENFIADSVDPNQRDVEGCRKVPEWKRLSSKDLGIKNSMIARPTRVVMNGLKRKGFDVYLVGGCVRDLILKRTPKDFDIITTAGLKEVTRTFSWCEIVGKRFPICHVHVDDTIVEVSSFWTSPRNTSADLTCERPVGCNEKDYNRWRNCLQRDFTINGLMFDPYENLIYDYIGGLEDIREAKIRTVAPASLSLVEDCARILRAVRIAARLGFGFTKETAHTLKRFALSVLELDKGRLLMEMNYMLAYGSSEASLRLLWRFGLLELLLPIQAAYFVRNGFRRHDKKSNMLLSLFANLDKLVAPNRPCHNSLWVALLAFHKALSDEPRDPLVVAAFSLAVHNGGDIIEALNIAKMISKPHDASYHELLEPRKLGLEALREEVTHLGLSVSKSLSNMTDENFVSQAMAAYPNAPFSDLVFIPLFLYLRVVKIFECVNQGKEERFASKQGSKIDYELLALGSLQEVRHVFARIVFDTLYPIHLSDT